MISAARFMSALLGAYELNRVEPLRAVRFGIRPLEFSAWQRRHAEGGAPGSVQAADR